MERPGTVWGGTPGMTGDPLPTSVLYVATFRIPADGVEAFQAYERAVLPILRDHGGRVERRLRGSDGQVEVHLLRFASADAFDAYLADPRRTAFAELLTQSGATVDLEAVADLPPA